MSKRRSATLSDSFIRRVSEPGRYGDGHGGNGLSLLVKKMSNGRISRTFSQRLTVDGKPTTLGLGSYPVVSLAEARELALENRRSVARGEDPRRGSDVPTLAEAAETVIRLREPTWSNPRSAAQWRSSLERHVLPTLGAMPVDEIRARHILDCLADVWTSRPETARRLRQRLSIIMRWAVTAGVAEFDPAAAVTAGLPRHTARPQPHRSVHYTLLPDRLQRVRDSGAWWSTKLCFEILALTAVRSGEARGATWDEVNLDAAIWTVPADRMKSNREHRVPLSSRALEVLDAARDLNPDLGLVFPALRGGVLSDNTVSKLLRELNVDFVPHGLRSTFRDWCGETGVPRELAEQALAHVVPGTEGSYARSDLLERRRPVMEAWGLFLTPA